MNIYADTLTKIAARGENKADSDIIKDGLRHCANCGEAKETRVTIFGKEHIMPSVCKCRREKDEELKRQAKITEKMCLVEGNRRRCFGNTKMHLFDFSADDRKNAAASDACRKYTDNWETNKKEGEGLLLYGDVGTGKTFLAACIANAVIDKGERVLMTSFAEIMQKLRTDPDLIDDLMNYPLLILDDLGTERTTEYGIEQVYMVIDMRNKAGNPIIITTNIPIDNIKNPIELRYKRIYDRILDTCHPIKVDGKSRRRQSLYTKFFKRKEVLGV
jgi:DNA replication protein DnaC